MIENFTVGRLVQLKSGGPMMTVTSTGESGFGGGPVQVFTTWFNAAGKRETDSFLPGTLEFVDE